MSTIPFTKQKKFRSSQLTDFLLPAAEILPQKNGPIKNTNDIKTGDQNTNSLNAQVGEQSGSSSSSSNCEPLTSSAKMPSSKPSPTRKKTSPRKSPSPKKKEEKEEKKPAAPVAQDIDDMSDSDSDSDSELMHSDLSKEQRELMRKNHMAIQMQFKEAMERQLKQKMTDIASACKMRDETVTDDEINFMLSFCKDDEMEVIEKVSSEPNFIQMIREMMEEKKKLELRELEAERNFNLDDEPLGSSSSSSSRKRKREPAARDDDFGVDWIPSSGDETGSEFEADSEDDDDSDEDFRPEGSMRSTRRRPSRVGVSVQMSSSSSSSSGGGNFLKPQRTRRTSSSSSSSLTKKPSRSDIRAREPVRSENPLADGTIYKKSSNVSGYNLDGTRRAGRLMLDDALKNAEDQSTWSEARRKAWAAKGKNPNAYYYRFNDPGETQRHAKFTKEEEVLFFNRLKEVGPNVGWGVFASGIPGRVGYQCSAFYRKAIVDGKVKDNRYWMDEKGKLRFNRHRKMDAAAGGQQTLTALKKKAPPKSKKKKAKTSSSSSSSSSAAKKDVGDTSSSSKSSSSSSSAPKAPPKKVVRKASPQKKKRKKKAPPAKKGNKGDTAYNGGSYVPMDIEKLRNEHPLKDMIDPITKEPVEVPAISPYGHVLGMRTWHKVLNIAPKFTCPFTKQPLKPRQCTKITKENYHLYEGEIRN